MNTFIIILYIIIVLGIATALSYVYMYNKINDKIIRIDEAENRIDENLRYKYDDLTKLTNLIKNKIKIDDKISTNLAKLKGRKISNFNLDRILVNINNQLTTIYEKNKELKEDNEIYKTIKNIEIIDEELVILRKYYNANITLYNEMIKKIPTLFVAKIKKYNERLFYDLKNMSDEDINDFKL